MKRMIAIALFAAAGFLSAQGASAQISHPAHYQTVQYVAPPVPVAAQCTVNGVNYPVDANSWIWAVDNYGNWFIIGRIVMTRIGPIAIRNDGMRFPAVCQ